MKKRFHDDGYRFISLIFAGIILAILAYSLFFGTPGREHPIPSGSAFFNEEITPGTGLSRSFSAIVRFQFTDAKSLNPYGIRIFLFFLLQLFMRSAVIFFVPKVTGTRRQYFILTDIILTITLFIISFWPFIEAVIAKVQI